MDKEKEVIFECGSTESDEVYRLTQSFQLIIRAGPPVAIPVGALVRLRPDSARENFHRLIPMNLKDPDQYEVVAKFRTVNAEGYWENFNVGDVLELTLEEALPLMRNFKVRPKRGGENNK